MKTDFSFYFKWFVCCSSIIFSYSLSAQNYTLSGYIYDNESGETMIGANIYVVETQTGTTTNTAGFYSIDLPAGDSILVSFSYVGYEPQQVRILPSAGLTYNVRLLSSISLEEIEVVAERVTDVDEVVQMSTSNIPVTQIKSLPSFLGEVDIMKAIQLMPGIQAANGLQSGIYVRGGSKDQNLVILDGVPIYNVSHVLGLFSVFNADAIKNVNVIKGGFPARYGGRLSSVVEMNMKDGNENGIHGEGSIGLISSKIMVEGPITKNLTFLVSGRRMYWDLLAQAAINSLPSDESELGDFKLKAHFYDINGKMAYTINPKNRLFFSLYNGRDVFTVGQEYKQNDYREKINSGPVWGNSIQALRWNWQISDKAFLNTKFHHSRYELDFKANYDYEEYNPAYRQKFDANYISGIEDYSLRTDLDWALNNNNYIKTGIAVTAHEYNPGVFTIAASETGVESSSINDGEKINATEYNTFVEDEFNFGRLRGNVGLHFSVFQTDGTTYNSLEPRLGLNYNLGNRFAIKASYARMRQYINLVSSEALSLPSDFWVPSTATLKPQLANQYAIGLAKTLESNWEITLEGYYKTMENVVSYKEGTSFFTSGLNSSINWEDIVTQGTGEAYGLEFLIQKEYGDFTGWLGYTLAWNWRQFDEINQGKKYPYFADRRHDLSIVGNYSITEKIFVSGVWRYATGNAVSIPNFQFLDSGSEFPGFTQKNTHRLTSSHGLDLSIEFRKKRKDWERAWVIGAYNVYNHVDPIFITRRTRYIPEKQATENYYAEIGILPITPSISYRFKF